MNVVLFLETFPIQIQNSPLCTIHQQKPDVHYTPTAYLYQMSTRTNNFLLYILLYIYIIYYYYIYIILYIIYPIISIIFSTRFVVKPEGGQQCIFDLFLTKPVGNENMGVERYQRGLNPPDKSFTDYIIILLLYITETEMSMAIS